MDITFDTATGQLSIDHTEINPWGADLRAMLNRHGRKVSLKGVKMHLTIAADGVTVFDLHLPPPNVRYKQTDQDVLATGRVHWQPDQEIVVSAWCKRPGGEEVTATDSFTAPRPAQPFPSWVWDGTSWQAPVERPQGEGWVWDEGGLRWALNINTADKATLQSLSGVGASLADQIIAGRPWASPLDLASIGGVSAGMVEGWMANPGLEAG